MTANGTRDRAMGALVGLLAAGLVVAGTANWLGGRRFGPVSVCLGLVVALAVTVDSAHSLRKPGSPHSEYANSVVMGNAAAWTALTAVDYR